MMFVRSACLALILGFTPLAWCAGADSLSALEEQAFRAASQRVAPSVVSIETLGGLEKVGQVLVGTGPTSGLIVSADGFVISSAFNFMQQPTSILVSVPGGGRLPARVVATDRNRMLTLLKIEPKEPLPVPTGAPDSELRVGQWTIAVGRTFQDGQPNMSVGVLSARDRIFGKAIQTDAKISPSNYGGPLVDLHGRILGVLVPLSPQLRTERSEIAGVEWYDSGIGFAVPWSQVEMVVSRLKEGHDLHPGLLGVVLKPGDMFADSVELQQVRPNSPAYEAGLKAGDRIVSVDGVDIPHRARMQREVNRRYAGETLNVVVARGEEQLTRSITLAEKLEPYERPALGLLPLRGVPDAAGGVGLRWVFPEGAAARAGLRAGDRIRTFNGEAVADAAALATLLSAHTLGKPAQVTVVRGSETLTLEVLPTVESATVPDSLPPARPPLGRPLGDRPEVGSFELKVPESKSECAVYVPESYDPRVSYGIVLWLHGDEAFDRAALVQRWQPACVDQDLILVAPRSSTPQRWATSDAELVFRALGEVRRAYTIDPLRVVLVGRQTGAALSLRLAFTERSEFRGAAVAQMTLPTSGWPDYDPEFRFSLWVATAATADQAKGLEAVRKGKYPVVTHSQGEKPREWDAEDLGQVARWIDALDRL